MTCPSREVLEKYLAGELADAEHEKVESHVSGCIRCQKFDSMAGEGGEQIVDESSLMETQVSRPPMPSTPPGFSSFDETIVVDPSTRPPPLSGSRGGPSVRQSLADIQDTIPGYKVLDEIHRGGQGVIYRAIQVSTKRQVAVKVMLEGPFASAAAKRRFEREIELAASLRHPNITPVFDSGIAAGRYYYAMEYIDGYPLDVYAKRNKLTTRQTVQLVAKIAAAVNFAHQRAVIHRDLKPGNILVDEQGEPHVLDFGLAKQTGGDEPSVIVSMAGQMVGTLPYMSPEQARGDHDDVDIRSDVYALGVILFQLLTGQYPYQVTGQMAEVVRNIIEVEPKKPSSLNPDVDDEVETIILKSLAKESDRRYQSAGELNTDLRRYLSGEAIEAKRDSAVYMLKKTIRRYKLPVAIASSFVLIILGFGIGMFGLYRQADAAKAEAEKSRAVAVAALGAAKQAAENEKRQRKIAESERENARQAAEKERKANAEAQKQRKKAEEQKAEAQRAAEEEKKAKETAEVRRREAEAARKDAVESQAKETAARKEAEESAKQVARSLIHADLVQAQLLAEKGEAGRSWLHCARAIEMADRTDDVDGTLARAWVGNFSFEQVPAQLIGHDQMVASCAFSPDAKRIATGAGPIVQVFDVDTGKPVGKPMKHGGQVVVLRIVPGGQRLLTLAEDDQVRTWSLPDGEPIGQGFKVTWGAAKGLKVFSPDGARLLTTDTGRVARLWDVPNATQIGEARELDAKIRLARFSPDGTRLVLVTSDGAARLFAGETGESIGEPLQGNVSEAAFTPDGEQLATAGDAGVHFFDAATGQRAKARLSAAEYKRLAFDSSGMFLAVADTENRVSVYRVADLDELADRRPIGPALVHVDSVETLSFADEGRVLVVMTSDPDLKQHAWIEDPLSGKKIAGPLEFEPWLVPGVGPALDPTGTRMAIADAAGTVQVWETARFQTKRRPMVHDGPVRIVSCSPNGAYLAVAWGKRMLTVRSLRTGQPVGKGYPNLAVLPSDADLFSPGGELLITTPTPNTVQLISVEDGKPVSVPFTHEGVIHDAVFSPDGKRLVTCSGDRTAKLWDVANGTLIGAALMHDGPVRRAAFSPDGKRFATASADKTVRLFNAADATPAGNPIVHPSFVTSVRFNPNGKQFLTLCQDMAVRIWTIDGKPVGKPMRHEAPNNINSAVYSPDGKWIATTGDDQTARLWHAEDGTPAGPPMEEHEGLVTSAVFSPNSRFLLTACDDQTARLWSVETGQPAGQPFRCANNVRTVTFTPDGAYAITGCTDGSVRLWPAYTDEDAETIRLRAEVATVACLEAEGIRPLTPEEWRAKRLRLLKVSK